MIVRHVVLGLFFLISMALLLAVTVFLGEFSPFSQYREFEVHFADIDGLRDGDPVMVYGMRIGRVRTAEFTGNVDPQYRIRVLLGIERVIELRDDYRIEIGDSSLLGGKRVDIVLGEGTPLAESAELFGTARANPLNALGDTVADVREPLTRTMQSLANIMESVEQQERSLIRYILDEPAVDNLNATLNSISSIAFKIDGSDGTIGKLLNESVVHDRLANFLETGSTLLDAIANGNGTVGRLLSDDEIYENLLAGTVSLRELLGRLERGEGAAGRLLHPDSDPLYENLASIMEDLSEVSDDLASGRGVAGQLIQNEELGEQAALMVENLAMTSQDLRVLVDGISRGRGVLGYLVADEQAARDVQRIVSMIVSALEDAREAAPVSSVASFLFGNL